MASVLVEQMSELSLVEKEAVAETVRTVPVMFRVAGMDTFELELELTTAVRDVKRVAKEECNVEPEHMRLIYNGVVLKEDDTLEVYEASKKMPVQVHFTAGHEAMMGGGVAKLSQQRDPFTVPVRGLAGSKGMRPSRVSGRLGGHGLIRKYGILMKRQEFREKAEEIGFVKYR